MFEQNAALDAQFPIVRTKLEPPQYRSQLLVRDLPLKHLADAEECALAVVVAPAGFGKTTLLMQWRRRLVAAGRSVAWLSLEESDGRESRFFAALVAALCHAGCELGRDALVVYEQQNREDSGERFVLDLINEICELEQPLHLVLDDFHLLTGSPVPALVQVLIARAPAQLHVVIASRAMPGFPLATLSLRDRVAQFGADDLRFNFDETRSFLAERVTVALEAATLRTLYELTEGWAGGLQLVAIALNRAREPETYVQALREGGRDIGDFLAAEVLTRLPADLKSFLIRTSLLPRFCASLSSYVCGVQEAERLLRQAETENLFLIPLDAAGEWFRYHHLFQAYLRRCATDLPAGEVAEVHRRAADWFGARGLLVDAVEHALASGEAGHALDLVERCAMQLVEVGNLATLMDWLDRLPAGEVARRWELKLAQCWALLLSARLALAQPILDELLAELDDADEDRRFKCATLVAGFSVYRDDSRGALALAEYFPPRSDRYHVAAACNIVSFGHLFETSLEETRNAQTWAQRWEESASGLFAPVYGQCFVGYGYFLEGRSELAREVLSKALARAEQSAGPRAAPACVAASLASELLYERNELALLLELTGHRLEIIRELVMPHGIIAATRCYARARLLAGETWAAEEALQRLRGHGEARGCLRMTVAAAAERVRQSLIAGRAADAHHALAELEAGFPADPDVPSSGTGRAARREVLECRARYELAAGDPRAARAAFGELGAAVLALGWRTHAIVYELLAALADWRLDAGSEALVTVRRLLPAARGCGLLRSLVDAGAPFFAMLDALEAEGGLAADLRGYLGALRGAAGLGAPAPAGLPPGMAEHLSEREHEILRLLHEGLPNKVIATTLLISLDTVKWHLKNLYRKLEVPDRYHAVRKARALGLVGHAT
ncbi:MAG: AAA family ATPase [Gammaproteobacteria bacterium]|nr:AAA family ATPase [Gammaproteobacteria bacterium]